MSTENENEDIGIDSQLLEETERSRTEEIETAKKDLLLKVEVYETVYPQSQIPAAVRKAIEEQNLGILGTIIYSGVPFGQEIVDFIQAAYDDPLSDT